ncbi:MAG: hypothetical protein ACLP2F_14565 [Steroidobacteraceae bacterium]
MNIRRIGLAVITVAALTPTISNASPEKASFDACVVAFEKSIATPGAAVPAYKVIYRGSRFDSAITQYFATGYTYDLEAHNPKTGVTLARARCSTDRRATVIALSPLPLDAHAPALAAQL